MTSEDSMRILTVRPPWAQMIVGSFKHVENRTRNLAGDYRGPVAIHAGQREDTGARQHPEVQRIAREYWGVSADSLFVGQREQFGHIIGVANLWAVHKHPGGAGFLCCPNAPERYSRWAEPGVWHLCFSVPRKLAEPIPFKGALGLRTLDDETTARVLAQIAPPAPRTFEDRFAEAIRRDQETGVLPKPAEPTHADHTNGASA